MDLVGMATLSDMVPLTGENRVFAHFGLQVLRKSPRKGLIQLLKKLKINQRYVTEDDIAFMITPRINAASRMGVPMDAFHLLTADNDADADTYATHLDAINNERKGVVASLVKEVKKTVRERHGELVPSVIVLGNPEWRPSLLGLAANSCAEEFNRPVFLWGRDGEKLIKGSCRSDGRTHVVELMRAVPIGVFSQFGGHHFSGGFAVSNEQIHYLEQRLNEAAEKIQESSNKKQEESQNTIDTIDMELQLEAINSDLHNEINQLAPFGTGNAKPVFLFRKIMPANIRIFGKGNEHIELIFQKKSGEKVSAISFFGINNPWAKTVQINKPIDLIASVEKSMFRGRAELRLRVVDVV
jgi:single-stranded-DNA-specific exonuclease